MLHYSGLFELLGEPAFFCALLLLAGVPGARAQTPPQGTWERLGPEGGEVVSLAAGGGVLYLGTPDGHIFASNDGARHWEARGHLTPRLDGVVQRLVVDAHTPRHLFAAVWFQDPAAGGGVYRSDDAGHTWSLAGLPGEALRALERSTSQPDVLVAGGKTGVFRSSDDGHTWERISPPGDLELRNLDSLAIDPRDPRVIYAGTYHLPWKTADGGKTWAPAAEGMIDDSDVMALRVDAIHPARLYASACSGIYRSENGGGQWTKLEGVPYAARRTQDIAQDAGDPRVLYAGTTEGLWITRDSGETWTRATARDWIVNGIAVLRGNPAGPPRIVLATENLGIQVSDDEGLHFAPSNAGFSHRLLIAFAADPAEPGHWLARLALPDNAVLETRDAGRTWQPLGGSDAFRGALRFFGTPGGWLAAPAEGGLLRYDEARRIWRPLRFVPETGAAARAKKSAAESGARRVILRREKAVVRDLLLDDSRVWVATSQGLWSGEPSTGILRSFPAKLPVRDVLSFDWTPPASSERRLWAVTAAGLSSSADPGGSWRAEQLPAEAGAVLWVRYAGWVGTPGLLVGARNGIYRRALGTNDWKHLGAGLPSAEVCPPLLMRNVWVAAAQAGGLYFSSDAGATWMRLDGPREASLFVGMALEIPGTLIGGSRTEGMLLWKSAVVGAQ